MMNSGVFWKECNKEVQRKPIYKSKAILEQTGEQCVALITSEFIQFNSKCIFYDFDLKFGIRDNAIYFEQNHQIMDFKLPLQDEKKWREILKFYLNQKGFHETFRAIKKIGKGNFASVYLVEKIQTKERFAVKAFSKQAAYAQENGKQCLIKEIQIMRQFTHPHLMKLQEVFQSDNSLYIVFQLLDGGQLYDKIKARYKFTPADTQRMMRGLLEGLQQMHSKGIMHRDLKPENILIRSKNSLDLVIADFGLAEFVNSKEYLFVRCGTPGYVAPEVINIKDMKKKYSSICDIFSAGIIFHVFLFGYSVFRKKTYNQVLAENRACNYSFQEDQYKQISKESLDLLKKMLRVNPDERITAEQALDHPYFKQNQPAVLKRKSPQKKISNTSSLGSGEMKIDKDSCVQFKMGKQNVMLGKNQTVADTGKTKVSMFGQALGQARLSKVSKFTSKPISS